MMKFQYQAPDGGVYEIEAPNEQAVQAIIQQQFGGSQSQQQKPQATTPASIPSLAGAPYPQPQKTEDQPSELADFARGIGRGVSKGAVGFIPRTGALIEDAFYAVPRLAEWGITGKNDYLGPQWNRSSRVNNALDNAADLVLDRPQAKSGRYAETVSDFLTGTATGYGLATKMAPLAAQANPSSALQRSGAELVQQNASNPGLQMLGSGAAGMTTQALDENGVTNPLMRLALPVIAGVGASGVASGAKNVYDRANVGRALDTPEGVRRAGGTIIRDIAQNPDTAAGRLARATGYVPGVTPTGPSASRDYGIMAVAPQLENYAGGNEVSRQVQNARARTQFIQNGLGLRPEADAPLYKAMEDAVAAKKRIMETAKPVDVTDLMKRVKNMDAPDESQKNAIRDAKSFMQSGLADKVEPITERRVSGQQPVPVYDDNGVLVGTRMVDISENVPVSYTSRPGQLYALKTDVANELEAKNGPSQKYPNIQHARSELTGLTKTIDDLIEQGAPGYKAEFRDPFKAAATGVDRLNYLRDIIAKSSAAGPDAAGNIQMSPPQFLNQMRSNRAERRRQDAGRMTMSGLAPEQRSALNQLYMDMAQENLINQRGVRATGSNTSRNLDFNKRIDDLVQSAENPLVSSLPGTLPVLAGGAASLLPFGPVVNSAATMFAVGAGNRIGNYIKNSQAGNAARRADAVRASLGEMYTNPDAMRQALELAKTKPVLVPDPVTAVPGLLGSTFPTVSDATEDKKKKKRAN